MNNKVTINGVDHSIEDLTDNEKALLNRVEECRKLMADAEFAYAKESAALEWIQNTFVKTVEKRVKAAQESKPEDVTAGGVSVGSPSMTVN
jgi:hypothetical protein